MSKSVRSGGVRSKKTAASRGKGAYLASESDPGEKIGYQLARHRIEGVILCIFCLESGGSGHSPSPSPPPPKAAVSASTRGRSAALLPKGTYTSRFSLQSGPPFCSIVILQDAQTSMGVGGRVTPIDPVVTSASAGQPKVNSQATQRIGASPFALNNHRGVKECAVWRCVP